MQKMSYLLIGNPTHMPIPSPRPSTFMVAGSAIIPAPIIEVDILNTETVNDVLLRRYRNSI